jgi:hypothetical protein
MTESEQKWIETNRDACAVLRQLHDMLALSSLPPRRTWVGLTNAEIEDCFDDEHLVHARNIERLLKEKNT